MAPLSSTDHGIHYYLGMSAEDDAQDILRAAWPPDEGGKLRLPVDPFAIAQALGIKAYSANLDGGVSGMLVKRAGEDAEIYVHGADSRNRQRFTCAHELGHYVKRTAAGDTAWEYVERRDLLTSQGTDADEIYANQFAAALLMPREVVEARFRALERPSLVGAAALAVEFGVSADAMRYRIKNLGLV
jgi:Zn-dependent peptidase ImmA (M78 family)